MMDIHTPTDAESENARLRRRVEALERDIRNLREQITPLLRRSWRAKFQPKLWQFFQYEPREVAELTTAFVETPPPPPVPRIAIVTPSHNYADFLRETVMSVITQAYPNLAYVVQDNNSTDGTAALLADIAHGSSNMMPAPCSLILRREADHGQANAINRGFAQAPDAEIMAYLNADDILLPGTLAYVARMFLQFPDVDVVYGHRIFIDADGWETGRCVLPNHDTNIIRWADYIPQETMFWRRRVWDRIGPFDESFRFAMDWDFILHAHDAGFRFKRLPRFLGCFRVHDRQKTSAIHQVGAEEQKRLRRRHLGYEPTGKEIRHNIKGYLRRHVLFHRLYKLRLLNLDEPRHMKATRGAAKRVVHRCMLRSIEVTLRAIRYGLRRGRHAVVAPAAVLTSARPVVLRRPGIPIVFLQAGESMNVGANRFWEIALRQAALASPGSDVILLTDVERPGLPGIIQVPLGEHYKAASKFMQLYRHVSANDFRYELICFRRWFYIRDFVRRHGITRFCMFDCDILLFSPVEVFAAEFGEYPAGNWAWANTISSLEALDLICEHFETVFRNRRLLASIAEKYRLGATPHLSDMLALFELAEGHPAFLNQHTLRARGFDDNINGSSSGLFVMDGPIKSLTVGANGIPLARRTSDGAEVPFHFLHFAGPAKIRMAEFAWEARAQKSVERST